MLWASLLMTIGMPCRLAAAQCDVVQIEPGRVGVELQQLAVLRGGGEDRVEVDGVRLAAVDQPAGGMGDDRDVRVLERAENAVGDLLARLLLAVVDAGDDPVGLGQHVVGQVHAAFFEDVALDAFEDREVVELAIERVDFLPLLRGAASGLRPLAMLTRGEWSVMAMYLRPRSHGGDDHFARAWPCRRWRWCACAGRRRGRSTSISFGSLPAAAQANSWRASRISGGKQGRSSAA